MLGGPSGTIAYRSCTTACSGGRTSGGSPSAPSSPRPGRSGPGSWGAAGSGRALGWSAASPPRRRRHRRRPGVPPACNGLSPATRGPRGDVRPRPRARGVTPSVTRRGPSLLPDVALAEDLLEFLMQPVGVAEADARRDDVLLALVADDVDADLAVPRMLEQVPLELLNLLAGAHANPERRPRGVV